MVWIKRNLLLFVSGLAGLILIGLGTYLVMGGMARNKQLIEDVEATRTRANGLYEANPFPSQTNIAMAKRETDSMREAIARAHKHFPHWTVEKMDARRFTVWRDELLNELRDAAKKSGTELPAPDPYPFSFATQHKKTQFSPDTFPHVPEQMVEVRSLSLILFGARVNRIGNIRRARVSTDDKNSTFGTDYTQAGVLDVVTDTAAQMISSPYEVTFYSFSEELAEVLNRLDRTTNFIVKAVQVEPEDGKMGDINPVGPTTMLPVNPATPNPPPNLQGRRQPPPNVNRPPPTPAPISRPTASDRPVHLLKEKRLKVTMLVYALRHSK